LEWEKFISVTTVSRAMLSQMVWCRGGGGEASRRLQHLLSIGPGKEVGAVTVAANLVH
jgi:hypothetical protein